MKKFKFGTIFVLALVFVVAFGLSPVRAESPSEGGDLVVALGEDPEHLNPALTTGYPVAAATANVYSALTWRSEDGEAQPDLAKSWDVSDDYLEYTFYLQEDVRWHDGEAFTSADVKFSMEELLANYHGRFQDVAERIADIETPDDYTVVITLEEPYAPFLSSMTVFDAPILPRHLLEDVDDYGDADITTSPVGTGPFQFVEWERGDRIVLERYDDYHGQVAYMDRLYYNILPDTASRTAALETGEVDYIMGHYFPRADIPRFRENPDIEVWQGIRIPALWFAFVNHEHPELGDPLVRQALMHATDRDLIIELSQEGLGNYKIGPMGASFEFVDFPETNYENLYPYNPDRARELLDEAGVDSLDIEIIVDPAREDLMQAAEIMQDNFRQIDVNLSIDTQEREVMIENVYEKRNYDLSMQSFTSGGDPASGYHRLYTTQDFGTPFVSATGYSKEEVDELLSEAASTPDVEERKAVYEEALNIIAQDVPILALYEEESVDVNNAKLRGLRESLDVRDKLNKIWWSE